MPLSDARKSNQGFTLIELLIIVVVIGILAAIAAPSFLGFLNRSRVNDALASIEGALKEAQREAMRRSTNCEVTIPSGNAPTLTASPASCLPTGSRTLDKVTLRRPSTMASVIFNFKGGTSSTGTVVIASSAGTVQQKCLVISPGIGIMRTGNYSDSDTSGASADNCTTPQ